MMQQLVIYMQKNNFHPYVASYKKLIHTSLYQKAIIPWSKYLTPFYYLGQYIFLTSFSGQ